MKLDRILTVSRFVSSLCEGLSGKSTLEAEVGFKIVGRERRRDALAERGKKDFGWDNDGAALSLRTDSSNRAIFSATIDVDLLGMKVKEEIEGRL